MNFRETLKSIGIIPVIQINDAEKAVLLALALKKGGLPAAEGGRFRDYQSGHEPGGGTMVHCAPCAGHPRLRDTDGGGSLHAHGARFCEAVPALFPWFQCRSSDCWRIHFGARSFPGRTFYICNGTLTD